MSLRCRPLAFTILCMGFASQANASRGFGMDASNAIDAARDGRRRANERIEHVLQSCAGVLQHLLAADSALASGPSSAEVDSARQSLSAAWDQLKGLPDYLQIRIQAVLQSPEYVPPSNQAVTRLREAASQEGTAILYWNEELQVYALRVSGGAYFIGNIKSGAFLELKVSDIQTGHGVTNPARFFEIPRQEGLIIGQTGAYGSGYPSYVFTFIDLSGGQIKRLGFDSQRHVNLVYGLEPQLDVDDGQLKVKITYGADAQERVLNLTESFLWFKKRQEPRP